MTLANSAEGGTNSSTVTTGNSGGASGTAWDTVTIAANSTLTYSNTAPFIGGMSYLFTTSAQVGNFCIWNTSVTSPSTTMYARCYCRLNSTAAALQRFIQFTNASIQANSAVGLNSAQTRFVLRDSTNTIVSTSTTAVPYGSWFRIEYSTFSDASVGVVEAKIYLNPQGIVPDEVLTTTATINTRGGNISAIVAGNPSNSDSVNMNLDEIAMSDTGYIGPVPTYPLAWLGT